MKNTSGPFRFVAVAIAVIGLLFAAHPADAKPPLNPVIFVHGGSGSGAQFESQAMRFTSNGYPHRYIAVLEYDSSAIGTILPTVLANLDALIAQIKAATGRQQVDLLGHSLGTIVCQTYLSTPARAANVAHYVNIDGASAAAPPGGVPTLALWAGGSLPIGSITGATNVTLADQEHVQSATSPEAFFEMYSFFRGQPPATTDIVPEPAGQVAVEGRVAAFPQNSGLAGATLEIWEGDGATGFRLGNAPIATRQIGASGDWGPIDEIKGGRHYEFAVLRTGQVSINYFYEPFLRSDHLVRLNVADALGPFIDSSPNHVALTVIRFKEFWGDKGAQNDVLSANGTDVINAVTAPSGVTGLTPVTFFIFDDNSDGVSNVNVIPFPFGPLPFLSGADLFIPTAPPGSVPVVTVPRGNVSETRTVNVPNLPSTQNRVVVQLNDFEQ